MPMMQPSGAGMPPQPQPPAGGGGQIPPEMDQDIIQILSMLPPDRLKAILQAVIGQQGGGAPAPSMGGGALGGPKPPMGALNR